METPQNTVINDPSMIDVLNLFRRNLLFDMACHHIGTIETFYPEKQTADISINYKQAIYESSDATGLSKEVLHDYPLLLDCPVVCLGGGQGSLRFPIAAGDECLVLFNDRDLTNWHEGDSNAAPESFRLHNLSDGIAIVGVRSLANILENYDANNTELSHAKAKISLSDDSLISVKNDQQSLKDLLSSLIDNLSNLDDKLASLCQSISEIKVIYAPGPGTPTASSTPVNIADFTTAKSNIMILKSGLNTIKTNIGGLLK